MTMTSRHATTIAVGLLAGVSCLLTAYLLTVPLWVLFIAWASVFAAGGGVAGLTRSLVMNLIGGAIAALTLLFITAFGGAVWAVTVAVTAGAAALVALSAIDVLSFTPAGFFGFASVFGIVQASGLGVTSPISLDHPIVVFVAATIIGAVFGLASQKFAEALTHKVARPRAVEHPDPA